MSKLLKSIDIPLFDVKDQRIIEKKTYKVDLYDNYIRYELSFKSDETDEAELEKRIGEITDDKLRSLIELPTKVVKRKEVSYIDRLSITAIDFSRSSEQEFGILTLTAGTYEERFFYKEMAAGIEFLEILREYRWG